MSPPRRDKDPVDRFSDAMTVGTFRAGAALARVVPGFLAEGLATPIGFGASFANAERRAIIERHLKRVNPHWGPFRLRQGVQDAFDSYARYWIEAFRLPSLSDRAIVRGFEQEGFVRNVEGSLARGKGVILALPHLGGWEWAGRWLATQGFRVTVVVEEIEPPELFEWFVRLRTDLGMTVVALGPGAAAAIVKALNENQIVCLLSDRDIGGGGVEVEFFGERTTLPAGPATLSLRTGAPIVPVGVYFTRRLHGHLAVCRPPLDTTRHGKFREDVARVTQDLARELEYLIRRAPEQWHLFQPNWPSDPGYERNPR